MASGNTLVVWTALSNEPPTSNAASLDTRNNHPVLDFDASGDEIAIFSGVMPRHYAGGGITVTVYWMATSATSGNVKWDGAFERHQDDTDDLDSDSFASYQTTTDACASASGELAYTEIEFENGSEIDSIAVGESFRFRVRRNGSDSGDTMTGDAELKAVELQET
jgi:hypothetical protein